MGDIKLEYRVEFTCLEETGYSVSIKAGSPEEAIKLFKQSGFDRGDYHEEFFNGTNDEMDIEVTGFWKDSEMTDSFHPLSNSVKDEDHSDLIPVLVCPECGSNDVDCMALVNVNNPSIYEMIEGHDDDYVCNNCNAHKTPIKISEYEK